MPATRRAPARPRTLRRALLAAAAAGAAGAALVGPVSSASAAPESEWDRLAVCESGGNWAINTGNGYHGGLQFSPRTWSGFGGGQFARYAYQATREQQIVVAERVLAKQGWRAWPSCSRKLGLRGAADPVGAEQRLLNPAPPAPVWESAPAPIPAAAPAEAAPAAAPGGRTAVVAPGDTLYRIAARNGVAGGWAALYDANRGTIGANPAHIRVGQVLVLP
ncbi:LysM peptidoglycan-binding domain-containing protein [Kineococcus sp. SYSU DK004]|uniref:LysM peptidoglycan-binding domain-containing protein n=1 Tax=Kineococcus sp. SYSU DK004 TaxID=3383125 RepID=UPI003D7E9177